MSNTVSPTEVMGVDRRTLYGLRSTTGSPRYDIPGGNVTIDANLLPRAPAPVQRRRERAITKPYPEMAQDDVNAVVERWLGERKGKGYTIWSIMIEAFGVDRELVERGMFMCTAGLPTLQWQINEAAKVLEARGLVKRVQVGNLPGYRWITE